MKPLHRLMISALLLYSKISWSQNLTLHKALSEALADSPKLQKAHSQMEQVSWKRVEASSGFLPTLTLTGTYLTNKEYMLTDIKFPGSPVTTSIPQILPTTIATLSAQWSIFDGFSSTRKYQAATYFETAAEKDFDWSRFQTELEVVSNYYKALAAQTLKNVAEQNVRTLEDHLKDVTLYKSVGVSTNYDVLRVEVQVSEARAELLNSADNADVFRLKLSESLGKEMDARPLSGELPVLNMSLVKNISANEISERSDVKALQSRLEGMEKMSSAAASYLIPKLSIFGQYHYYNNINDDRDDRSAFRNAHSEGLQLTWNIFDGLISPARSAQSIEEKYQAEKTLRIARLKALADLEFWKRKYIYFCTIYQSRQSDIGKSSESVRLAKAGRKAGTRTSTELLDSELELFKAKAGAINAQLGAIDALIQLQLASGKKLYDFQ